jgi:hypothetical protein
MTFRKVSLKPTMDQLEISYTVDLLARLTESIETYLDDDRWDGIDAMHKEIKEANKLVRKYYKRIRDQEAKQKENEVLNLWNS